MKKMNNATKLDKINFIKTLTDIINNDDDEFLLCVTRGNHILSTDIDPNRFMAILALAFSFYNDNYKPYGLSTHDLYMGFMHYLEEFKCDIHDESITESKLN